MTVATDIAAIGDMVRIHCGLRCDGDGAQALSLAVDKRMSLIGAASPAAYAARLAAEPAELAVLINLLTVNETYFFREADQLRLVVRRLGRLLRQGRKVRILSAGCSTGEEVYSLVMAFHDAGLAAAVEVVGIDIDDEALAKARQGRYAERSVRTVPEPLKQRFLIADPRGGHQVSPELREGARFARVNLLAQDGGADLGRFDAILFRNVSIYFDQATRRQVMGRLARMLEDDGCLIVGASETLSNDFGVLRLVAEDGVFFFANERPTSGAPSRDVRAALRPPIRPQRRPAAAPRPKPLPPLLPSLADATRLTREKRFEEALALVASLPADADAGQLRAEILFLQGRLDDAERTARAIVDAQPWCADTLVMLGQIERLRGNPEAAIRWLKQAIYTRPVDWVAHFGLAELYRRAGRADQARREYAIVVEQLSRSPAGVRPAWLQLAASAEDIRTLCRRHMTELEGR